MVILLTVWHKDLTYTHTEVWQDKLLIIKVANKHKIQNIENIPDDSDDAVAT